MNQPQNNEVILRSADGEWLHFCNPRKVLCAYAVDEVLPLLAEAAATRGWAAGFVSYEAASAFDSALPDLKSHRPLLWFGIYDEPVNADLPTGKPLNSEWTSDTSRAEYFRQIDTIKKCIEAGESYQVNYTIRMRSLIDTPWQWFLSYMTSARFSAYIQTEELAICSASPELFFELDGCAVTCRPMKGTGRSPEALLMSEKDRAENIMIVDMIRNDLGRFCIPGTIVAAPLFEIEAVGDIWQMTSTVKGETEAGVPEIFKALFPCASITGAPKRRTMQIIDELERSLRGVYCGAVGYIAPQRKARFSVAIRTAEVNRASGDAVYGVGGGIVWDSLPESEWNECALKTEVLSKVAVRVTQNERSARLDIAGHASCGGRVDTHADFHLLETMLYDNKIIHLEEHIARLTRSAAELGFKLNRDEVINSLRSVVGPRQRLRLLLSREGIVTLEKYLFPAQDQQMLRVTFAKAPLDSETPRLFHKTTDREIYNRAKAAVPDADEVILWNTRGEVTESTIANVVAKIGGQLVTPPVRCGLLPGTMRAALLKRGKIHEGVITCDDLRAAKEIFLINSLRGWMPAEIIREASRQSGQAGKIKE